MAICMLTGSPWHLLTFIAPLGAVGVGQGFQPHVLFEPRFTLGLLPLRETLHMKHSAQSKPGTRQCDLPVPMTYGKVQG